MSFQICIKTNKTLQQLATEIQRLCSLPPFSENAFSGEPYCQFEMLGMLILIQRSDEEERDPEVRDFPFSFNLQMSFTDHNLDTDEMEYHLQPYYAQLLSFNLGLDTAYPEKKQVDQNWQVRYRFCRKNPEWRSDLLFGEKGWQPAIIENPPSTWRALFPMF